MKTFKKTLKKTIGLILLTVLMAPVQVDAMSGPHAFLQDDKQQQEKDSTKAAGEASNPSKREKQKDKKSEYEKLIDKGGSFQKGVFGVRHIEEKWYAEVPDSMIGRLFLVVSRFTSTPQGLGFYSGEEITRSAVYFERRDNKTLLLRSYVQTHLADERDNISKALQKSAVDPIVATLKVIGRPKKEKTQLVEITPLFKKDNNVFGISSADRKKLKVGALDDTRTFVDTIKAYPMNVEVVTTRTYNAEPGTTNASKMGAMTIGMNTSVVLLPKDPMRPRYLDTRVGYFADRIVCFSDQEQGTESEQIVSRFRLEPKDPKAYKQGRLVEPKRQIVFYIDPATPKKWIPYLIKGVNDWNVAFEAAGFKNAIVAKEWPGKKDMSLEDARYCVLRYLPSDKQNAYGPRVVDPRSGEIIESHICWYHDVMKLVKRWYMVQCGPMDKRAQTMDFDDELMGQLIRFVSSHEVGHTLGLCHNMGASSQTPVENLRNKKWVEAHGHTISIMDYARFNYVAQPEDGVGEEGLFPRINDYDKWAIKWGYQYRPEFKDAAEEKEAMAKETTEVLRNNPRLWFGGEGTNNDPRAQREDLGDDNAKAGEYGMRNLKRVAAGLLSWTYKGDEYYSDFRSMYEGLRQQYQRYIFHATKNLGTRYVNNLPGKPIYEDVPKERVRAALLFANNNVFNPPYWLYRKDLVDHTTLDVDKEINDMQLNLISKELSPETINTISAASRRTPGTYRVEDYLTDVFNSIWKPLNQDERTNAYQREAQRFYVKQLSVLVNGPENAKPEEKPSAKNDAHLYAISHLALVKTFITTQLKTASGINKVHYEDLLLEIQKLQDKHAGKNK
ncbi:MAG: zinc-dependent metalloprotease [Prevotella sp.]|nr:zinc-dependent metalloprotease [Prevotella sp.]